MSNLQNAYALLIGVGDWDIPQSATDAEDIYKVLIDENLAAYMPENVKILTKENATRNNVIKELDELIEKTKEKEDCTVIILYSGHGGIFYSDNPKLENPPKEYFLCTHGFKSVKKERTGIRDMEFKIRIDEINSKRKLVLLDCCHAAGIVADHDRVVLKNKTKNTSESTVFDDSHEQLLERLSNGEGNVTVVSCGPKEKSIIYRGAKNSLFTHKIIEGLEGAGTARSDDFIRAINLIAYVVVGVLNHIENERNRDPEFNHTQTPRIAHAENLDAAFTICRNSKKYNSEFRTADSDQIIQKHLVTFGDHDDIEVMPEESYAALEEFQNVNRELFKEGNRIPIIIERFLELPRTKDSKLMLDKVLRLSSRYYEVERLKKNKELSAKSARQEKQNIERRLIGYNNNLETYLYASIQGKTDIEDYINDLWDLYHSAEYLQIIERLSIQNKKLNLMRVDSILGGEIADLSTDFHADERRKEEGDYTQNEFLKYRKLWKDRLRSFLFDFQNIFYNLIEDLNNSMEVSSEDPEPNNIVITSTKSDDDNLYIKTLNNTIQDITLMIDNEDVESQVIDLTAPFALPKRKKKRFSILNSLSAWLMIAVFVITILMWGKLESGLDKSYVLNLIIHIGIILLMINWTIRPKIHEAEFRGKFAKDTLLFRVFDNNFELYKFYNRANVAISQFGTWWRGLGFSFLALYVYYFFAQYMMESYPNSNIANFFGEYKHHFDIVINGSEIFFLYIIFKLLTDRTLIESYDLKQGLHFTKTVNWKSPLKVILAITFVFIVFGIIIKTNTENAVLGIDLKELMLVGRITSSAFVAVSLSLIVGRLDSKFIGANKFWYMALYLYAAIQVLFILFDKDALSVLTGKTPVDEAKYVQVTTWTLYIILVLKMIFIAFVYLIHHSNRLFYYFLLGSKINDFISEGIDLNPWVVSDKDVVEGRLRIKLEKPQDIEAS